MNVSRVTKLNTIKNLNLLRHLSSRKMVADKKDKRQKREEYRAAMRQEGASELPRKKFYRQRAHANPFSDHQLI